MVLIVSDALRYDILGCYGGPAETPNIDQLAQRGMLFKRVYSTAPCTFPSSVSMLTGMYARSFIVSDQEKENQSMTFLVNDQEQLIGEQLSTLGYDVYYDVENGISIKANNIQGFEKVGYINGVSPSEIDHIEKVTGIQNIGGHQDQQLSSKYDKLYAPLNYLLSVPQDQKYFLLKWFLDPHAPYHPPEKFRRRINYNTDHLPKEADFYSSMYNIYSSRGMSKQECMYLKKLYQAEVESVDERVGFILKALEHNNRLKDTIIIFTADHGELFGEHNRLLHDGVFFEPLLRVPLIISGPKIPKGKLIYKPVSLVDLVPTLMELLKIKPTRKLQGESFAALLKGKSFKARDIFADHISNQIKPGNLNSDVLIRGKYKLMNLRVNGRTVSSLYDLQKDPRENENIAQKHPTIVREMFKTVLELREECNIHLKENLSRIDSSMDLDRISQENLELLKALGYIK